ncbi:MAG: hypothetical protein A2Y62_03720 [Candidatus Fischerbacteria bacterium RBG_13_37_8]|uniref:Uncharacterized protein n=1 Tax=Candidatus Fischerbacteria bacterium RBG_13_37_8 TaxID=1817863 RepID=A0A1F5V811_9BACT|nr:MAG: hypothetical protein A2Y62_03720 [Candidatus Fischerbacteria bacterium RBG_13_37_8]
MTTAIAVVAVFLGDLNAVAPYVSMFFLTTYGVVNIVAALETLSGDPSWRPKIHIPWAVNLIGGIACLGVIFFFNPIAGMVAILTELIIWIILSCRKSTERWGDARRGIYETLIRWALIKLSSRPMSARNWRPHVLVFVSDPVKHLDLIRFGNWFSQGRGVVTVCELVVGDIFKEQQDLIEMRKNMQDLLNREGLVVFAETNIVNDVVEGISSVAQANGMAGLQSNTILLGWPKERAMLVQFLSTMRNLEKLRKSLVIGRVQPRYLFPREGIQRSVHIWWGGDAAEW